MTGRVQDIGRLSKTGVSTSWMRTDAMALRLGCVPTSRVDISARETMVRIQDLRLDIVLVSQDDAAQVFDVESRRLATCRRLGLIRDIGI